MMLVPNDVFVKVVLLFRLMRFQNMNLSEYVSVNSVQLLIGYSAFVEYFKQAFKTPATPGQSTSFSF